MLGEGPQIAIVTDGINGSWGCTKEGISFHQPAFLFPHAVDTTGCGDSYHGAFLAGLVKGYVIEKAAMIASAVSGMNTQHIGGRSGIPSFGEVKEYLSSKGIALD